MEGRSRTWEGQAGQMSVGVTGTSGSPSGLVWCGSSGEPSVAFSLPTKAWSCKLLNWMLGWEWCGPREPPRCPRWACSAHGLAYASNLTLAPRAKYPLMCLFWCGLENRLISQLPISVTIGMRFYRESVAL